MRNTKADNQPKKEKVKSAKKVCHYCQHDNYDGTYSRHLQNHHKKEWGIRQLVKSLSSEDLEQVKQYILKEIKSKN